MYSIHLTGNPWFLLILIPGLWIIWRQYQGLGDTELGTGRVPKPKLILFFLQALALVLLVISLTAPELRRHKVEFHNPAIIILRDQSGSFRAGEYLGIGSRYLTFQKSLADVYEARKFDIRVVDFSETAWPKSGFPGKIQSTENGGKDGVGILTSMNAAADFVDSTSVENLQGVFLFSDGRSNLDSGKATRTWNVPLFPVVFSPDSISEIQPERISLEIDSDTPRNPAEIVLNWTHVGSVGKEMAVRVLQGKKTVFAQTIPLEKINTLGGGVSQARLPWNPDKGIFESSDRLRAIVQPGSANENTNPFNDTVDVRLPRGRTGQTIHVLRPIRSLDEKSMLDILQSLDGIQVSFFGLEDMGRVSAKENDQIWIEAGALAGKNALQSWLQTSKANVVIYSRPNASGHGSGRNAQVPGWSGQPWKVFSAAADIKVAKAAADAFPDEVVRLKGISVAALDAPVGGASTLVTLSERGNQGMLMGRIPIGQGKRAFFFCLPAIWNSLFDPLGDFSMRENVAAYVRAAYSLAGVDDGTIQISIPAKVFHLVAFDLGIRFPESGVAGNPGQAAIFSISGANFSQKWPLSDSSRDGQGQRPGIDQAHEINLKDLRLPEGRYLLELNSEKSSLWRDSLQVSLQVALELAKIGFNYPALEDAALRSGGKILSPSDSSQVTSMLPNLPAAQIRVEKIQATKLYNTLIQCLFVLALLGLSWLLRKKWDLD